MIEFPVRGGLFRLCAVASQSQACFMKRRAALAQAHHEARRGGASALTGSCQQSCSGSLILEGLADCVLFLAQAAVAEPDRGDHACESNGLTPQTAWAHHGSSAKKFEEALRSSKMWIPG